MVSFRVLKSDGLGHIILRLVLLHCLSGQVEPVVL